VTKLITVREAAALLRVCEDTVYNMVKRRELPSLRIGHGKRQGIRFDIGKLEDWISRNTQ